jgi:hypothetical protein
MPNHCESDLSIVGDPLIIEDLLQKYKGDVPLDANKIIPYPKRFLEADRLWNEAHERCKKGEISWEEVCKIKDGFNSGGYEWCVTNWGTKWGMYDFTELVRRPRSVFLSFQSAWSPPYPLIKKMSEDFPDLTFTMKYYEGGMQFKGTYKVKAGRVLVDESTSYQGTRGG